MVDKMMIEKDIFQKEERHAVNSIKEILIKLDKQSRGKVLDYINGWAPEITNDPEKLENSCKKLGMYLGGVADARIYNVIQYCKNMEEEIKRLKS